MNLDQTLTDESNIPTDIKNQPQQEKDISREENFESDDKKTNFENENSQNELENQTNEKRVQTESILEKTINLIDNDGISNIQSDQIYIINKLENTNLKLDQVNKYAIHRFIKLSPQIKNNTKILLDTKKELDSIFKRIKILQEKVRKDYPDNFKPEIEDKDD